MEKSANQSNIGPGTLSVGGTTSRQKCNICFIDSLECGQTSIDRYRNTAFFIANSPARSSPRYNQKQNKTKL